MKEKFQQESGNALIYVLVAIALFAALSFTLARQNKGGETGALDDKKARLYATQIISYAAQAQNAVQQMIASGSDIDELDFTKPSQPGFNTAPTIHKLFHPDGGGLSLKNLDTAFRIENGGAPPGIYVVKKNVEWTKTIGTDVILSFYGLQTKICNHLAEDLGGTMGSATAANMYNVFALQANVATLNTTFCAACDDKFTFLVNDSVTGSCTFYTILTDR